MPLETALIYLFFVSLIIVCNRSHVLKNPQMRYSVNSQSYLAKENPASSASAPNLIAAFSCLGVKGLPLPSSITAHLLGTATWMSSSRYRFRLKEASAFKAQIEKVL